MRDHDCNPSVSSSEGLRILRDHPMSGEQNMAIDRSWLKRAEDSEEPLTLIRFYQWDKPTVSLGAHQTPERAVDQPFCLETGIPIVSRPTGGRAVLHGNELTYSVVSNDVARFPLPGLIPVYQLIAECLKNGLDQLGIETTHSAGERTSNVRLAYDWTKPCFTSTSRHELVHKGRKIVGSAQRRLKHSFLQHGSVPIEIDYEMMGRTLRFETDSLRSSMVSVSEAAGRHITFHELATIFESSFQDKLCPNRQHPMSPHQR